MGETQAHSTSTCLGLVNSVSNSFTRAAAVRLQDWPVLGGRACNGCLVNTQPASVPPPPVPARQSGEMLHIDFVGSREGVAMAATPPARSSLAGGDLEGGDGGAASPCSACGSNGISPMRTRAPRARIERAPIPARGVRRRRDAEHSPAMRLSITELHRPTRVHIRAFHSVPPRSPAQSLAQSCPRKVLTCSRVAGLKSHPNPVPAFSSSGLIRATRPLWIQFNWHLQVS
jgi:hypothetical protein